MKFKGGVSISRNSNDEVNIRVYDGASRVEFVDISMTLENYALLITGMSRVEAVGEVRGLEYVGKEKFTENRSVECPLDTYDKAKLQQWLVDNCQEDGWELNTYLGSQGSIGRKGGVRTLNYSVYRYEDKLE